VSQLPVIASPAAKPPLSHLHLMSHTEPSESMTVEEKAQVWLMDGSSGHEVST
jgi:hypothetical protein